jgi:protocatechuate 3,4-dioxygenase beta subunit
MDVNMTRREALAAATAGGAAVMMGGELGRAGGVEEAFAAATCVMTPNLAIGPYFVEEKLNRSDVRGDREGVATTLTMHVFDFDKDCAAVPSAQIDIWHCDALGTYSDVQQNGTKGQTWLRGFQTTDAKGVATFVTIFPGYYQGRTTHIHVRVRVNELDFTTQIFFTEDQAATVNGVAPYTSNNSNGTRLKNAQDGIYQQGGADVLLVTLAGTTDAGYTGELSLGVSAGTAAPAPADDAVDAAFLGASVVRRAGGSRRVRIRVNPAERLAIAAKLTRRGRRLGRLFGELAAGAQTVTLRIPRSIKAGPAKLNVTLTDEARNTRTVRRAVHIPKKRT